MEAEIRELLGKENRNEKVDREKWSILERLDRVILLLVLLSSNRRAPVKKLTELFNLGAEASFSRNMSRVGAITRLTTL
jgi:hypothetical protein